MAARFYSRRFPSTVSLKPLSLPEERLYIWQTRNRTPSAEKEEADAVSVNYEITLETVSRGYDRRTCWVHARAGVIPPDRAVLTAQKLRLSGSDIFYVIHSAFSADLGRSWSPFVEQPAFAPRVQPDGSYFYVSDFWPKWQAWAGVLLGTGHTPLYREDRLVESFYPRRPAWSVYDPDQGLWKPWQFLEIPNDPFYNSGAGCAQRVDRPNGDIFLPIYFTPESERARGGKRRSSVSVLRCRYENDRLTCLEIGNRLTVPEPRGLGEPSLAYFGERFYLTLRNDLRGYVSQSADGLHFAPPRPWRFDDGAELGSYNTQQHWLVHSHGLFLVYTRRGANNDHVFRHRAPLFMARVDPERLCVLRETERIVVPERGARLGNFGVAAASAEESWVVVAEWMQTTPPRPFDSTVCERYGSDNSVFLARIRWNRPNALFPWA